MAFYSDVIVYFLVFLTGAVGAISCRKLPFFDAAGLPGAGFFPIVIGSVVALVSLIELLHTILRAKAANRNVNREAVIRVFEFFAVMVVITSILTVVIGLIPALALFMIVALILWDKIPWKRAVIFSVLLIAVVAFCFVKLLNVSFPMGLFVQ